MQLDSDLSIISAGTFLGGSNNDVIVSLALDNVKNVYASGYTQSDDFPGVGSGSADSTFGPYYEGFVTKLTPDLSSILASTFIGGNNYDNANNIVLDSSDTVYVAGSTYSPNFPSISSNSADSLFFGTNEGFVAKLNSNLSKTSVKKTFPISIKVKSPNGGELLTSGTSQIIAWQTSNTNIKASRVRLHYKKGGKNWKLITTLSTNSGSFDWIVPSVKSTVDKCMVKVTLLDARGRTLGQDSSDSYFTIRPAP